MPTKSVQRPVRLQKVVRALLSNGELRDMYHRANQHEQVRQCTHHGWIHILIATILGHVMAPILRFSNKGPLDECSIVDLALLLHDQGLVNGREGHALHGAMAVEEILSRHGVSQQVISILHDLVRWHRAGDFLLMTQQIAPDAKEILAQVRAGHNLAEKIPELAGPEAPSSEDIISFLEHMENGIPMMRMLSLVVLADILDTGKTRVRRAVKAVFDQHLPEAKRKRGRTLEDVLNSRGVEYSPYDLINYAVETTGGVIEGANRAEIQSTLIQKEVDREKRVEHEGLFLWAQQVDEGICGDAWLQEAMTGGPKAWVRTDAHWKSMEAKSFTLYCRLNREVCSPERLLTVNRDYFGALQEAARCLGLEPRLIVNASLEF